MFARGQKHANRARQELGINPAHVPADRGRLLYPAPKSAPHLLAALPPLPPLVLVALAHQDHIRQRQALRQMASDALCTQRLHSSC